MKIISDKQQLKDRLVELYRNRVVNITVGCSPLVLIVVLSILGIQTGYTVFWSLIVLCFVSCQEITTFIRLVGSGIILCIIFFSCVNTYRLPPTTVVEIEVTNYIVASDSVSFTVAPNTRLLTLRRSEFPLSTFNHHPPLKGRFTVSPTYDRVDQIFFNSEPSDEWQHFIFDIGGVSIDMCSIVTNPCIEYIK